MDGNNWDWNKVLPSVEWYKLQLARYPGWERYRDGQPAWVKLAITPGVDRSSRDIAVEWDDLADGNFYYRDVTADNLPFARDGDVYEAIFCFQKLTDARHFVQRYGGYLTA